MTVHHCGQKSIIPVALSTHLQVQACVSTLKLGKNMILGGRKYQGEHKAQAEGALAVAV
jgi:hypothetical protein